MASPNGSVRTQEITQEFAATYKRRHGRNIEDALSFLGKTQPFIAAIQSELGQELLGEVCVRIQDILSMVLDPDLSEKKQRTLLAELRALKAIHGAWTRRIAQHLEELRKVNAVGSSP